MTTPDGPPPTARFTVTLPAEAMISLETAMDTTGDPRNETIARAVQFYALAVTANTTGRVAVISSATGDPIRIYSVWVPFIVKAPEAGSHG